MPSNRRTTVPSRGDRGAPGSGRRLSRELLAGASLGLVLGVIDLSRIAAWQAPFGSYGEQAHPLAMIVAVSLVGVVIWGVVAGAMLPFALRAIGLCPASASRRGCRRWLT